MKYVRRFAAFFAKKLVLFVLVAALLIYVFYMAYGMGDAYIIVNEGMEKRVRVCLTREDYTALNGYFTVEFLQKDPVLAVAVSEDSPYYAYSITDFKYQLDLSSIRWHPMDKTIDCTVTEHVSDITGTSKTARADEIPAWKQGRYFVKLKKQKDGKWKITSIKQDMTYKDVDV